MSKQKKAVIALDLSKLDDQLLHYTKMMSAPLNLYQLNFVHVVPDDFVQTDRVYGIPEGTSLMAMADTRIKNSIQEKINDFFPNSPLELSIVLLEGTPAKEILNYIEDNEIDLLIAGRKENSAGSGLTPKKIARKASSDFLFVPEIPVSRPRQVMVPIDYSDSSAQALYAAVNLKKSFPDLVIMAPHIMRLLPADYYFGLDQTQDFLAAHLKKNQKEFTAFIKEYNFPDGFIQPVFLEDHSNSISRRLLTYLKEMNFDLVIMGAQGHSALNSFIYGSVTERFIHYCEETPLMVVR